jgi:hypothetical protein
LQNLPEIAKCHGLEPRNMAGKEKYESGIPSTATSATSRVKSIYICNDPTGAKIEERAEEHIQTSKPSYILTTSHYRVPAVVRSTSQVQQIRPPEESSQAGALTDGAKGANREIRYRTSIHGCRKHHKSNICKNSEGNVLESLKPTDCFFHRIVLGGANYPLGKIELDVCFGNRNNYRREKLEFKVMDWPSQYHAVLGRPAFAKLMAVPHYAYLMLKIPGPKGTIMVQGSFEVSNTCDKEFNRLAQTFGMTVEYARLKGETDHNMLPDVR